MNKHSNCEETKVAAISALSEDARADFLLLHAKYLDDRIQCSTVLSGDTGIVAGMFLDYMKEEPTTARFISIAVLRRFKRYLQVVHLLALAGVVHLSIDLYQYLVTL